VNVDGSIIVEFRIKGSTQLMRKTLPLDSEELRVGSDSECVSSTPSCEDSVAHRHPPARSQARRKSNMHASSSEPFLELAASTASNGQRFEVDLGSSGDTFDAGRCVDAMQASAPMVEDSEEETLRRSQEKVCSGRPAGTRGNSSGTSPMQKRSIKKPSAPSGIDAQELIGKEKEKTGVEEDARKARKHRKRADNIGKRKEDGQDHTAGKNNMYLEEVAGNATRHMRRVEGVGKRTQAGQETSEGKVASTTVVESSAWDNQHGWSVQGWVKSLAVHVPIAAAFQLPSLPPNESPFDYLMKLPKDELKRLLRSAGLNGLLKTLWAGLEELRCQKVSSVAELNSLFTREAKYAMTHASLDSFFGGLSGLIGRPCMVNGCFREAMRREHCEGQDADVRFMSSTGYVTTSRKEWEFVVCPVEGRICGERNEFRKLVVTGLKKNVHMNGT